MDKKVEETIFRYLPRAMKIEDEEKGSFKIVLPCPVKEKEALRRALKESHARPTCLKCHSENTRFRYFNNSCSQSLQARYMCWACNQLFTFGGKKYNKTQNDHAMGGKEENCPFDLFKKEKSGELRQHTPAGKKYTKLNKPQNDDAMGGKEGNCPNDLFKKEKSGELRQDTPAEDEYSLIALQLCLQQPKISVTNANDLVSDDPAMGGKERNCPIDFFKKEISDELRQRILAEDDCLIDLQLCL